MDAVLALPPDLPPHDPAPLSAVEHRIVAEWPTGTFIENLVVLPAGTIVVSVLTGARIDAVSPDGAVKVLRTFEAPPTGMALAGGALYVAVGEPGAATPVLWRLDPVTGEGGPLLTLEGVVFANGLTNFAPDALLLADSIAGALLYIDLARQSHHVWLQDDALTRSPAAAFLPGANGVKRWRDEVTVSSNGRAELHRVNIVAGGHAGTLTRIAERLRVDDFAYDTAGCLYLATHIGHSLDRLDRDGRRVTLGGPEQGLVGSTACAFGKDGALYVTTTGGIIAPPHGRLEPAKLVRLHVDTAGQPLDRAWEIVP